MKVQKGVALKKIAIRSFVTSMAPSQQSELKGYGTMWCGISKPTCPTTGG